MKSRSSYSELNYYLNSYDLLTKTKESEVKQSEQRLRFFLALVTGTVAFIGIFIRENPSFLDAYWVTIISISILSLYGGLTFSRLIWSSQVIHDLDVSIGIIQDLIKERNPVLKEKLDNAKLDSYSKTSFFNYIKGTYAQYMYLTEGLLIGGLVFIIIHQQVKFQLCIDIIIAFIAFIFVVSLMLMLKCLALKNGKKNSKVNT
jgi:hypothetical protein